MNYARIVAEFGTSLWAMEPGKLMAIAEFVMLKARGGTVPAEARISQKRAQEVTRGSGEVAVLPVYGALAQRMNMMDDFSGGTSTQQLGLAFDQVMADPGVKAVVLDIDSPGGTVAGTQEVASKIYAARGIKPIVAQVNSTAASAAYWIATAADEIVVTPGGEAGSVGVYRIHEDITKMLEQDGIKPTIIRAGANKISDSGLEPLTDAVRGQMQGRVDQAYDRFTRDVSRNRRVSLTDARGGRFGEGLMFGAADLVERGMADRVATLEETFDRFGSDVAAPVLAMAAERVKTKWRAGEPPTIRDLEEALRGSWGLSKSEAEQAVRLSFKEASQGDLEPPAKDVSEVRKFIADDRFSIAMARQTA